MPATAATAATTDLLTVQQLGRGQWDVVHVPTGAPLMAGMLRSRKAAESLRLHLLGLDLDWGLETVEQPAVSYAGYSRPAEAVTRIASRETCSALVTLRADIAAAGRRWPLPA